MKATTFDVRAAATKLQSYKATKLQNAGYLERQAEALAEIFDELSRSGRIDKNRFLDTHAVIKQFMNAGLSEQQAEAFVELLRELQQL